MGLGLVGLVALAGCGSSGTSTRTVTVVRTTAALAQAPVKTTATTEDAAAPTSADFCAGPAGDKLSQAAAGAQGAFNAQAEARFMELERGALAVAKSAPHGAPCARAALNEIAYYLNMGMGGNLRGIDVPREVAKIRAMQRRHGLPVKQPLG
jgi:hypothetical protein